MKRVLFLAYLFPPLDSGTQRPLKFAKYLSEFGWTPTVVTAGDSDGHATDTELLGDIPRDIPVVRVPMLNHRLARACRRVLGSRVGGGIGDAIARRLQQRYRVPDPYALWKPQVTRAAMRIFRDGRFDAIYATGFPWTSLMAGRDIARLTGCPLIADFRDLWAGETLFTNERMPRAQELVMERQVVDDATAVVTASMSIARRLAAAHPHVAESKFTAIHNGFDPADMPARPPRRPGPPFRIVYTGVWKNGDNPSDLYDSIEWLKRAQPRVLDGIEVVAAGFAPGEARRRGLDAVIKEAGVVSHTAAVDLMQSADMLFLPHTDPQRQWVVPGKLLECLASGSPVFALTFPDKEAGRIVRDIGGGIVVAPDDPGALYDALGEICRQKRFDVPPRNEQALSRFERRRLTAQLAAILDDACYRTRSTRAGSSAETPTRSPYAGATSAQPATRVIS